MRSAGTAKQYSTKAIPQLTSTTVTSGTDLNLRWLYQAMVMNRFEQMRRMMGASWGQSPDAREAGGISTSRDVGGVLRLRITGPASSRRVDI
jgi:hypothetical protein